jgi:hypothetical protein
VAGANTPPIITNVEREATVREDAGIGTTVLTLAMFDSDVYPSVFYTSSLSPDAAKNLFYIVGKY